MKKAACVVSSASLLVLSFPNFNLEYLAWVALVPLFLAIDGQRPRNAFLTAYLTGVLFFLGTIYWLIHVTLPGMIAAVLYLALYFGVFGLFCSLALRPHDPKTQRPYDPTTLFFIPALWTTLELIRSHLFTGFGWALLGHSQSYNLPVIQMADIFGAYGISFLIVFVNTAIFFTIKEARNKNYSGTWIMIALFLVFLSVAYGAFRLKNIFTGERIRVAVIQGNIAQDRKWDPGYREEIISKYEALTRAASKEKVDLIVWPETSVPGFLEEEQDLFDRVRSLAATAATPLLVGTIRDQARAGNVAYYNSAVLFSEDGRVIDTYDKLHLVPFGEYIPLKRLFSFVEKFTQVPIGDCTAGKEKKVFSFFIERKIKDKDASWKMIRKVRLSSLICFEDIFPDISREFVRAGADFLVNMTNDAWYKTSAAPYQHVQSSVFRAVENRTNVVRAANTGVSCFIDQTGRITGEVESGGRAIFVEGYKIGEITLAKTKTLYTEYGNLFAYLCAAFTIMSIIKYRIAK